MNRLLIAATLCLGSCVGTPDFAAHLARDLRALAAAVEQIDTRLTAEANARRDTRDDNPPPTTASRRRESHAPALSPGAGTTVAPAPVDSRTAVTRASPVPSEDTAAVPAPTSPVPAPAAPAVETKPQGDPVVDLMRAVAELRARLGRERPHPVSNTTIRPDVNPVVLATPLQEPGPPASMTAQGAGGRFQIAGRGEAAWQTVLDTHTGVIYNFRMVQGEPRWTAITVPIVR